MRVEFVAKRKNMLYQRIFISSRTPIGIVFDMIDKYEKLGYITKFKDN